MLSCGLVGMPNVGKSTVFCALTKAQAEVSSYPFCTIEPNAAVVGVPDPRLDRLGEIFDQEQRLPAQIEFIDIAGLVRGAHQGHGLGNQFLARVRECDAILHVVRCFRHADVPHVDGLVDAVRDAEAVGLELVLADLETVQRRRQKRAKGMSAEQIAAEQDLLDRLEAALDDGRPARTLSLTDAEQAVLNELFLLTAKPTLLLANVDEDDLLGEGPELSRLKAWAARRLQPLVAVSARLEADLAELPGDEARDFVDEMDLPELGLAKVVQAAFGLLDLITFFTGVGRELRAWPVPRGTTAVDAAGVIHSDMAARFNKAEVVPYADLDRVGSWAAAREQGLLRNEGRHYVLSDGDVMHFKFGT